MSSKKYRRKLKEQYNHKQHNSYLFHDYNKLQEDRELILNYLKENPNTVIKRRELINNLPLNYDGLNEITSAIKHIIKEYNASIFTKSGYNGGYMYYGKN